MLSLRGLASLSLHTSERVLCVRRSVWQCLIAVCRRKGMKACWVFQKFLWNVITSFRGTAHRGCDVSSLPGGEYISQMQELRDACLALCMVVNIPLWVRAVIAVSI